MATEARTRLGDALLAPVDAASVAAFRIGFGLLMFVAVVRYFAHGWIAEAFLQPKVFFSYGGLAWVRPWPGIGMYVHFAAMGLLALLVAAGALYRLSIALFTVLFAYAHLIDKTNYLNHYYLLMCLGGLMTFLPLHRLASLDAWRRPALRCATVPAWVLWALRMHIGLVYFFGGVAKLKPDWLINAQPLQIWLRANSDLPLLGHFLSSKATAHVFSVAGAAFDLCIVPLLLWRKTRALGYIAVGVFHGLTMQLFHIGMFPWIMMASSLLFLPPEWPRRLLARLGWQRQSPRQSQGGSQPLAQATTTPRSSRRVFCLLGLYFAFHLAMPLRHLWYPGNVCWTEEGFRFAWNVMLMEKDGAVDYHVSEPATGRRWQVAPAAYLTRYQARMMATQPDMILQLAHLIADDFRHRGVRDPEVRVDAFASLNGRPAARLVDPRVDLARERDGLAPKRWILPLADANHERPHVSTAATACGDCETR